MPKVPKMPKMFCGILSIYKQMERANFALGRLESGAPRFSQLGYEGWIVASGCDD